MYTKSFCNISSLVLLFPFFILACSEQESESDKTSEKIENNYEFQADTLRPDNITFPEFPSEDVVQILEGVKICTTDSSKIDQTAYCNHSWFRVFKFMPEEEWRAGFLVEIKAGIYATTRQLVVIHYQNKKYKIINQYLGVLLEVISREDGFSDILMGYEDPEVGTIAIKHVWMKNKYEPIEVMEINNYFVKTSAKDSLNKKFVDGFYWGE